MIQTQRIALDTATAVELVSLAGSGCRVLSASDNDVTVTVAPEDAPSLQIPLRLGEGFENRGFARLRVSWAAQAGGWLVLATWGDSMIRDAHMRLLMAGDA